MTAFDLHDIPLPGPLRLPETAERTLPNGLRVLAARRRSTPLAELCLNVPFAHADPASAVVLAGAITADPDLQERLRLIGSGISAAVDADRLRIAGSVPSEHFRDFLALVAAAVLAPGYESGELATTVDGAVQTTVAMLADPAHRVVEAWNDRMFGAHPYGLPVPREEALRRIDRETVVALHHERVRATGASLVVAGDIDPASVLDDVEKTLGAWPAAGSVPAMRPVPEPRPGSLVIDEPGVTQSLLRLSLPIPHHDAPGYPAVAMAAMVFGGYFSSRLVQNIREDKGYCYAPRCSLLHVAEAHLATVAVDVITESTAAAVEEVLAELTGLVNRPVTHAELDRARRYATGTMRLRMATLTGLLAILGELDLHRLPVHWLRGHDVRLASVTPEQVTEAAACYLQPDKAVTVLLCDSAKALPNR